MDFFPLSSLSHTFWQAGENPEIVAAAFAGDFDDELPQVSQSWKWRFMSV